MTALQELIEKWEFEKQDIELVPFDGIISEAKSFLQKEKQQIIDAYEEANNKICESCWDCKIGEEYYKNTYEK